MCSENEDLETEYDNALFELTDVRERYPAKCANEFGECLRLTSEINLKSLKPTIREKTINTTITDEQIILYNKVIPLNKKESKKSAKYDQKMEKMLSQVRELKMVLEQMKNAESCSLSRVISKK